MIIIKKISFEDPVNWDGLIKESATATFFQTFDWLNLWHKHFGGNHHILKVYDNDELTGIAPFSANGDKITFSGIDPVLGGELVSDFGDIIVRKGREEDVWKCINKEIGNRKSVISNVELNFIREESPSFKILKETGLKIEESDTAPYIDLPKTWDEYLSFLDRHNRHEIRRKIRRLEGEKAFKICNDGDPSDIEEFFRLMSLSSDRKEGFLTDKMKDFFRGIFETFWQKKSISLCFMKLDGKNIAATLSFLYKDGAYLYNSGYDPEYNRLSPGLMLKVFLIKHAIEDGRKRFEFLRGGEKYKYSLGGKDRKLYKFVLNPTP